MGRLFSTTVIIIVAITFVENIYNTLRIHVYIQCEAIQNNSCKDNIRTTMPPVSVYLRDIVQLLVYLKFAQMLVGLSENNRIAANTFLKPQYKQGVYYVTNACVGIRSSNNCLHLGRIAVHIYCEHWMKAQV